MRDKSFDAIFFIEHFCHPGRSRSGDPGPRPSDRLRSVWMRRPVNAITPQVLALLCACGVPIASPPAFWFFLRPGRQKNKTRVS
jgi:hypothetical protein